MTTTSTTTATDSRATTPANGDARPTRLAVLYGSVREGRFGPVIGDWFVREAEGHSGFGQVDTIDLADHQLPQAFPDFAAAPPAETARVQDGLARRLAAADAFVVVTPEYNHSFPAPLKNTIDWFHAEWQAKPVGFVSYGGMSGGLRAVEQLRQVFAELHAVTVRDSLSFHNPWGRFQEDGRPDDHEKAAVAARGMLGQLDWWATALREARTKSPYAAAIG
ncbi:NADPH-dependent FMN reductase [Streptomyces oceani]|uniref:NADPH-dependent FMN reductase n=1 Tax=Streptomyces oceani TaxID=1075402 RepID=A0A1E7KLZ7_9ACTN|nr:NADPH-dependent FMN reductase [Streptomyces oceani]